MSVDYGIWQNNVNDYWMVAYNYNGKVVHICAFQSAANTGVQLIGSKYLGGLALPWGYKFVFAFKNSLAAAHVSCCVNYYIETKDESPPVEVPSECSMFEEVLGLCGGRKNEFY